MKLTVPMIVLAAGLSVASNTFAQQARSNTTSTAHSNTVLTNGTHEVRVESDGVTARITLDGNQVAQLNFADDWTTHRVTDSTGGVVATIWRSGPGATSVSAAFGEVEPGFGAHGGHSGQWLARLEGIMEDEQVREGLTQARGHLESALAMANREMPKVMIGITMDETPAEMVQGLGYEAANTSYINSVVDDGPAAKTGLKEGDVIVAFDNVATADADAIREALKDNNPGDAITISYIRDGAVKTGTITLEAYNPKKFGMTFYNEATSPGGRFQQFLLSDDEMSRLQKQIAELSEKLQQIANELATAIGARAEELGKLSAEVGGQIAELASELARRSASSLSSHFWGDAGGQDQIEVRVVPDGAGGSRGVYVMPAPAGTPAPPSPASEEALRSMDDRIKRIEELLEQLAKQQGQPSGGGNH